MPSVSKAEGKVVLPGSKSIANRALLMAALCQRPVTLQNMLFSDDTARMMEALTALGVRLEKQQDSVVVHGNGGRWTQASATLDLGNAGTAMRPLLAVLSATAQQEYQLTGNPRMQQRPIADLVDCLEQGNAAISYQGEAGFPPLTVKGGLQSGHFTIKGNVSSQYISAMLMALPLLAQDSVLQLTGEIVSRPYITLTCKLLAEFGITINEINDAEFHIPGGQQYRAADEVWVEGDASAASYWIAAAMLGGGPLEIVGVGKHSIQGDIAFAAIAEQMGANIEYRHQSLIVSRDAKLPLPVMQHDGTDIPDAAMTFAPLALFANGVSEIYGVANWRVKETDRLSAMANELTKLGAQVTTTRSSICITPPTQWQDASIATYDDHRMAMCFALCAFSPASVTIEDPDCVAKTYPHFFAEFSRLCH
ncbi:3-phosphoshikimate 1-carboxyvinyltransferase [Idiomarina tyrosinivorans]|uniref:3-phosphoshikimate 1-carboxyvinyltransferase n=1 Tax=Idiomarina tyrosinivorans TaxID=1445662 RepID=A0A432ZU48_9GAMM|nr:3-phosphoshikimate 1-carboxyvinyltransferase [Idiomarina tyrosinivorans]